MRKLLEKEGKWEIYQDGMEYILIDTEYNNEYVASKLSHIYLWVGMVSGHAFKGVKI